MLVQEVRGDYMKCKECKAKMYDYAGGKQIFSLCFKCGVVIGNKFDKQVCLEVEADPNYVLYLIECGYLAPMGVGT